MSADELIRRGDVERIIGEAVVSRPLHDSPASADRPAWAVRNEIAAAIRALPADRMAEAAAMLAEATHKWYWTPSAGFGSDEKRAAWTSVASAAENYRSARMTMGQEPRA